MAVRIVVPSEDQTGLDSRLAEHFGRAPYFTVVDFDENDEVTNVKAVQNTSEHVGGVGVAPDQIIALNPTMLIVCDMGARAINIFADAGVTVLRSEAKTVREALAAYRESGLEKLRDGCGHEHHH